MSKLERIVAALRERNLLVESPPDLPTIVGVTHDSRAVRPGVLFCAVSGVEADGHDYLDAAVTAGAAAAMVERKQPSRVPQIVVRDARRAVAVAGAVWFERPAGRLRLLGVTGTNGKSTTVSIIRHLRAACEPTGAVGTLGTIGPDGRHLESEAGLLTTPGPLGLQSILALLVETGARAAVLEASSHALHQHRTAELEFAAAVFTNLSRDHLDYHPTFEAYREAKLTLARQLAGDGLLVTNVDDRAWDDMPAAPRRISYGVNRRADLTAREISSTAGGSTFLLAIRDEVASVRLPLIGRLNVANALAAAAAAIGLGQPLAEVAERLASVPQVLGRTERIATTPCTVIRDYAHTPDALERVLEALRSTTRGRLIVVFGAGGDRDRGKRALMGQAVARFADVPIVTSDNPRTEDPERIVRDVVAGLEGVEHVAIVDRRAAIAKALALAGPGDCVVLAGKGHETYQVIGTERVPFDEEAIVRALLAERV